MDNNEQKLMMQKKLSDLYELFVSNKSASDLHIKTNSVPRLRINADIKPLSDIGILDDNFLKFMVGTIFVNKFGTNAKDLFEHFINKGHEEDFAIDLPNSDFRARLNIAKSLGDIKITFRKIPNEMPELDSLGFMEEHKKLIRQYMNIKEGLILITGQTGSGKSTTLASIIAEINSNFSKHIVTIEHPVEFRHKDNKALITHREVGKRSDTLSFTDGIVAAVRQDPDIILVGEMRDADTALAALQAAQTGHLVFATLHTNSAPETIVRLLDMFPPEKADSIRVSLGESLKMVISQKLVPSTDGKRILAYECLYSNINIKNAIIQDKKSFVTTIREQMHTKYREGMLTMNRCLYDRYKSNKITMEKAYEYSSDKDELKGLIED